MALKIVINTIKFYTALFFSVTVMINPMHSIYCKEFVSGIMFHFKVACAYFDI